MAADMHIHVFEGISEDDLALFCCNHVGSKWEDMSKYEEHSSRFGDLCDKIDNAPNIWIGEVSWLKADLFDDEEKFIPDTVQTISDLIGEDLPMLDDALLAKIMNAFKLKNATRYHLAVPHKVRRFLNAHKGKQLFTVSW